MGGTPFPGLDQGYPIQLTGGIPFPGLDGGTQSNWWGGTSFLGLDRGYPIQLMGGYTLPRSRWGYPFPGLDQGYPLPRLYPPPADGGTPFPGLDATPSRGTPPAQVPPAGVPASRGVPPGRGYPHHHQTSTACTCYAAGGVPLAFTEEEFLVQELFFICHTRMGVHYIFLSEMILQFVGKTPPFYHNPCTYSCVNIFPTNANDDCSRHK